MKRIVVHIGAQRTASAALHRGLYASADVLLAHGVLLPQAGRHELFPRAVRHPMLAWSFDPEGDHPYDVDVWASLADEIRESAAHTVLLSSELLAPVAADRSTAPLLLERLRALSDDVTLAFVAREQLGLLNSLYCQRVKELELSCDFETYLRETPDVDLYDLSASFGPWYDATDARFVAMPWDETSKENPLAALLALCDIEVPASLLLPGEPASADELGPVGVEATRLLGAYLRGQFPDFRHGEAAARRLRRKAATTLQKRGWFNSDFWGWTPDLAAETARRYVASNNQFAQRLWGQDWSLPVPVDKEQNVADLLELQPGAVDRVHLYLIAMESTFARLRANETAAAS